MSEVINSRYEKCAYCNNLVSNERTAYRNPDNNKLYHKGCYNDLQRLGKPIPQPPTGPSTRVINESAAPQPSGITVNVRLADTDVFKSLVDILDKILNDTRIDQAIRDEYINNFRIIKEEL